MRDVRGVIGGSINHFVTRANLYALLRCLPDRDRRLTEDELYTNLLLPGIKATTATNLRVRLAGYNASAGVNAHGSYIHSW